MGRWRRVMWCSVCMPRECVLIISSRAWWWCGAGRAGGRSFSRVLSGDGRRGRELVCHPEVVRAELRKVDGGSEEGSPGSSALARKSPPAALLAVGGLCCCGGRGWLSVETREHQRLSFDNFCLLPPASSCPDDEAGWRSLWRESTKVFPCSISLLLPASRAGGLSPGSAPAGVK